LREIFASQSSAPAPNPAAQLARQTPHQLYFARVAIERRNPVATAKHTTLV